MVISATEMRFFVTGRTGDANEADEPGVERSGSGHREVFGSGQLTYVEPTRQPTGSSICVNRDRVIYPNVAASIPATVQLASLIEQIVPTNYFDSSHIHYAMRALP